MQQSEPFAFAYLLDEKGGASPMDLKKALQSDLFSWEHIDYLRPEASKWFLEESQLDELICEAMLEKETRPRTIITREGILIILRTINLEPGAEPDDMLSIKIWAEENRIITASKNVLPTIREIQALFAKDKGPRSISEFLDELIDRITARISLYVDKIDEDINRFEMSAVKEVNGRELRKQLAEIRSQIIAVRRYIAPQRDALSRLTKVEHFSWMTAFDRFRIMETSDRVIRCLEDLDEARDRAIVVQETISGKISHQVEQRMYMLSMVAAIFLPLTFVTGLLGINVGGIPGRGKETAFIIVSIVLVIIAFIEYILFKKKRWL